jgi:DNA-binding NarL/FixJ family response regulator
MPTCSICGAETELQVGGGTLCVICKAKATEDSISLRKRLRAEESAARAEHILALQEFENIMNEVRSGIPHPDGATRLQRAGLHVRTATQRYHTAHKELMEFIACEVNKALTDYSPDPLPVGDQAAIDSIKSCLTVPPGTKPPRIVIADEHRVLLEGLKQILEPTFEVVAMVHDGHALIRAVEALQPDVAMSGIMMPMLNGIEALRKLRSSGSATKFVFLTANCDAQLATQAMRLGASCYILKEAASDVLIGAIHAAIAGQTYVAPRIAPTVFQNLIDRPGEDGNTLTARERQVLQLLAEGKTLKAAALVLKISPRTVEFHRNNIANKTGFHSSAELTRYAVGLGLVPQRP